MGQGNHAVVFGGSGISGWSLGKYLLEYPTPTTWDEVTVMANRPLTAQQAHWPNDKRLKIAHGINLLDAHQDLVNGLRTKVANLESVSHVFFMAYIAKDRYEDLVHTNDVLLRNAIAAMETTMPNVKIVILQTGGKGYGLEFLKDDRVRKVYVPPLAENHPRIPPDLAKNIFYYNQYDFLKEASANATWTFAEVRPDLIIGFVPNGNAMNICQLLGIYLSTLRVQKGAGAEIPFPGTPDAYEKGLRVDTCQDILAKFEIHCALHYDICGQGQSFNIADSPAPINWKSVWPSICSCFELRGVGPTSSTFTPVSEYMQKHKDIWQSLVQEHHLKQDTFELSQWGFVDATFGIDPLDRYYDLRKAKRVGFTEEMDSRDTYRLAFDRYKAAGILPKWKTIEVES